MAADRYSNQADCVSFFAEPTMPETVRPVNHLTGTFGKNQSGARKGLDARREARQFSRHRIGVNDALPRSTLHLGLRGAKRFSRDGFITAGDRGFYLLHKGPHAGLASDVARGTGFRLTDALTRRCVVRHDLGTMSLCLDRGHKG